MVIGVLDLQGAVREHLALIKAAGAEARPVKTIAQLEGLDGLIIPGGESTTIGKLMVKYGFVDAIKQAAGGGLPIYGTCAGLILLAKRITEGTQPLLSLMDIEVRRNAFGRQLESFEDDFPVKGIEGEPFHGVFIRAPWIESVSDNVAVLAECRGHIVMARQGNLLGGAFHPELTSDIRVHAYFMQMIRENESTH